jgi:hypothetical protein
MASAIISRLKKSKQRVSVVDATGNTINGHISGWDDNYFTVRVDNGDDVMFPLGAVANITVQGGIEKVHSVLQRERED